MMLLDKYLARYSYKEYHEIRVSSTPEQAYTAARNLDFSKSKTIKLLFGLRGLPVGDMTLDGFCANVNFTLLEEIPPREFIIGFWADFSVEKITDRELFAADIPSKRVKVVWNFQCDPVEKGSTMVSTETRVYCTTVMARLTFGLYWMLIRPFSGLIRKKMLLIVKQNAEQSSPAAIHTG